MVSTRVVRQPSYRFSHYSEGLNIEDGLPDQSSEDSQEEACPARESSRQRRHWRWQIQYMDTARAGGSLQATSEWRRLGDNLPCTLPF